jgi:hypothetical protein
MQLKNCSLAAATNRVEAEADHWEKEVAQTWKSAVRLPTPVLKGLTI